MTKSPKSNALEILASLAKVANLPTSKPPETEESKPAPWEAPQLVAQSDEDMDTIPW